MSTFITRFLRDEEGATAIEYGLIAGLIAVALVATLGNVREALVRVFEAIAGALPAAPAS
ncbi:Flp family type IVb pilin [Xylophilus sp. GW821-FHT01B05]